MGMDWNQIITASQGWVTSNIGFIVLGALILIQWIAFQYFVVHYLYFKRSLKQPKPSESRFQQMEQRLQFQDEQIAMVYEKIAELREEQKRWASEDLKRGKSVVPDARTVNSQQSSPSIESSYVSLGEINLKRRINAIKASTAKN